MGWWLLVILVVVILLVSVFRRHRMMRSFGAESVGGSKDLIPMHNPNWCAVRDALKSASRSLRRLTPPVMSTIQVGPSNGDPEGYRINLSVFTNQNLQPDEKQHTIDQARPIIERSLQSRGYPSSALSTFTYFVMYENSDRNMSLVGKSLESVRPQLRTLLPPVMSTYHLGPFSGEPDDFCIYLSVNCKDEFRETEKAELVERAKTLIERELRMNGYSIDAIKSFSYEIVHQEDIDKAGGWYSFLR